MTEDVRDQNVARDELMQFIERIEKLNEEKAGIGADIKDVKGEAKGMGYDVKAMMKIIKLRKMDKDTRDHEDAMETLYRETLGLL
jgi:uncharacterized protein (UPF0335 family)